jgi:ribosomal protein L37E
MSVQKCERCGQRPPKARAVWCAECLDERMRIDLESWSPLSDAQRHRLQALFQTGQVLAPLVDDEGEPPGGDARAP